MAVPADWSISFNYANGSLNQVAHPRAICPHCRNASTFAIKAQVIWPEERRIGIHLVLACNYARCQKATYVYTSVGPGQTQSLSTDLFFMYPLHAIDKPHVSVPTAIAEDWLEAQKSLQSGAPKAAAVMCRRVLYGVLLDKKCKLFPLKDGMTQLITEQRLPAIFDDWLPAIRDDGHDGAHPDRALQVDPTNIVETMEYTSELLRFQYIEPYEFQQRKQRETNTSTTSANPAGTTKAPAPPAIVGR